VVAFFQEMLRAGIYKRTQGRITRQITFAAVAITIALGLLRLSSVLRTWDNTTLGLFHLWFPGVLLMLGLWITYRLVNVPAFADFLIAVEAEMNKVSWPTRFELVRSSTVVLIMIIVLAIAMSVFDVLWKFLLSSVLHIV
jgi:preprotein translocase subunit SecE